MRSLYLLILGSLFTFCGDNKTQETPEVALWKDQAEKITVKRDKYGIAHVFGKSDADAVFGMIYAQCEDDFNRVEMNYLTALGRLAEAEGEEAIYNDVRQKLFIDDNELKEMYNTSEEWLKDLMDAWAAGINYFLYVHKDVKPKVITYFEPWMALSFSEGSIGGDIESVSLKDLKDFYENKEVAALSSSFYQSEPWEKFIEEPRGSNGISISPKNTKDGKTLFLINPHTSFFFRDEIHVISEEGLDAYGAVTWGQFFVYQGFNEKLGWMHTSSRADVIDIYKETILDSASRYYYKYDDEIREVKQKTLTIKYKTDSGMAEKEFIGYFTHHGPVISKDEDYWYTVSLMNKPVDALTQSYIRTKAKNYDEFYEAMSIRTNSSNNTVYADGDGNIAYFHGNFMPRRNPEFDYSKPLDGSISATDWQGLHEMSETFIIKNPENGWIQNCNSTPFTASGKFSPKKEDYPAYMAPDEENFRGIHAVKLLEGKSDFTLDGLIKTAYDSYTPGFEHIVPSLISAFETSGKGDEMEEAVDLLKKWDYRWGKSSVETTLAHFWGQRALSEAYNAPNRGEIDPYDFIAKEMEAAMLLSTFQATLDQLNEDFGTWKTPWEDVNRYQRLTGDIRQDFNDDKPSLGIGFVSGRWGSLASFGARTYPGTKKLYGTSGNSFVAFVEFGKKVKAKSITAGGISGDPQSDFFDNQAQMYSEMEFKEVNYYKEDIDRNLLLEYNLRD